MRVFKIWVFLVGIAISMATYGQSISSVYSNNGIGLINYQGLPHNLGMGEVGIGAPSVWNLNHINPAFLPLNAGTIFQVGLETDRRRIASQSFEVRKVSGGLRYLNLGFPIVNGRWTTSFGLSPFGTVNNKTTATSVVEEGIDAVTSYEGQGGVSALSWSNGFRIGESLFLGFRTSTMFGSVGETESTVISDGGGSYTVEFTDRTSYSGVKLDVSMGYRWFLNDNKAINFGAVYEVSKDLNGLHDQWIETTALTRRLVLEDDPVQFTLPSSLGFGASYQVLNKLTLASDIVSTNWANGGDGSQDFVNTVKVGFGAQFTPDYTSVNSYLKRVSYRMGMSFGNLPYEVNGEKINELGINIGGSFPVGYSNLDWAVKYGRLGKFENDLIRETYIRIVIGATINDRWFVKRRYD